MGRYNWSRLNHMQIGRYAEYFVKMEFTLHGLEVYGSEVDDHGIDLVIRKAADRYYDVQVKSIRALNSIFFPKAKFGLRSNLLAAVVLLLPEQPPDLYLIPAATWGTPDALFVSRDYAGLKSTPGWG